ncbi:MAG: helix-turn-helix domain-containing protein [Bacteroidales bacterium]|nr:helix-turn-helix domain-containing protein [Bacteroidales bacterium]
MEGLVLSSKISESAIICDAEVIDFNKQTEENQPDEDKLKDAINDYQSELINNLFNYKQLFYRFKTLEKNLREYHGYYLGNIGDAILDIKEKILPKISGIAQSFIKQVNTFLEENPNAEKNTNVQERLKKAGEYFIKFHKEEIIAKLENSSFETDNSSVKKAITENLSSINEILNIKQKSLKVCISGFNIKEYLEVRAKAALEDKKKPKIKTGEIATEHPALYSRLKQWRYETADEADVKLYMVLSNKSIQEIANKLPSSTKQLKAISGIGKAKLNQFGEEIISMVLQYLAENNIKPKEDLPEIPKPEKKKTWEITYELYKAGKTVEEIAKEREFTTQTIENHLGRYIETGELKISEFMNNKTVETIKLYFEKHKDKTLSEVKNALSDEITWSQLKLVQYYMKFTANKS